MCQILSHTKIVIKPRIPLSRVRCSDAQHSCTVTKTRILSIQKQKTLCLIQNKNR